MFFILNYKDLIFVSLAIKKNYGQTADKFIKNKILII